jgi:CheY-like chemotaxis protein
VRIQTVIDSHAGPIAGDADRLQQVIWNLLSNAVRFTPRNGRVQVRLARVDSHVEIVVTDSGAGIAADFLPHVFERFRQADSRFSRSYGGLGLGLAISRDLVELHGGTIHADSEGTGKGATFRVVLPLMAVLQDAQAEPVREHPRAERSIPQPKDVSLAGLLVLVVDDDEDAVTMMREVLEAAGATVSSAAAAAAALNVLSHSEVNALVTDLGMPEMDGFALLAEVRKSPIASIRNVPAAALTAYARSEDRIRTLSSGFQMHLAKPIDPSELVAAVAALANLKVSGG